MPSGQIAPGQAFPVSYSTTIPGDMTLYYVQAVLRDTQSSSILQTLNLKNVSSTPNRYTGLFGPVFDASGLGYQVDVTISVYTDPAYTVLSNNYQITQFNYTVLQPWIANLGTGGGLNIDYVKLQEMFDGSKINNAEIGNEVVRKLPKVKYDRIKEVMQEVSVSMHKNISTELKSHVEKLSKLVSDSTDAVKLHSKTHAKNIEDVTGILAKMEKLVSDGFDGSSKDKEMIRSELSKLLPEARTALEKTTGVHAQKIKETIEQVSEEMRDYLREDLSGKEIHMTYANMQPEKKKNDKPKNRYSSDEINSLLR